MRREVKLPCYWTPQGRPRANCLSYSYYIKCVGVWIQVDMERLTDEDGYPCGDMVGKVFRINPPINPGAINHYYACAVEYDVGSLLLGETTRNRFLRAVINQGILFGDEPETIDVRI